MRNDMDSIERGAAALDQPDSIRGEGAEESGAPITSGNSISPTNENGRRDSQATILLELCEPLELFHAPDRSGYAIIEMPERREVWPIQSESFRHWLKLQYFTLTERAAGAKAVEEAVSTLEARARYLMPLQVVFLRVARQGDRIYIDLADDQWRVIEIDASGWRVLNQSPVMFTRSAGMQALPLPAEGNLKDLGKVLNVMQEDLPLVVGWLLMAASGCGPYPILVLQGEQGSGKSTFARHLRSLIDPSTVPLRGLGEDIRDLLVTATNNHVIVLDNLSGLPSKISDALCRFATGGGFAERKLYTNREEVLVHIQRPIILNGIDEIATRGDLLDRAVVVHLPVIADTARLEESIAQTRFDDLRPGLLGGLCTALSHALRELPNTKLTRKPRMADFAVWATAAEGAMGWLAGTFMAAYQRSQEGGIDTALEASPFASALIRLMADRQSWSGTATELLRILDLRNHDPAAKAHAWPKTAMMASNALKRAAPLLRHHGIIVDKRRGSDRNGTRVLIVTKDAKPSSEPSEASETSTDAGCVADASLTPHPLMNQESVRQSSDRNALRSGPSDGADASDDAFPEQPPSGQVEVEI